MAATVDGLQLDPSRPVVPERASAAAASLTRRRGGTALRARLPYLLLVPVVVGIFALQATRAAHPASGYQSADERAYGKLALNIAGQHNYGDPATHMRNPLRWPPGAPVMFAIAHRISPSATSRSTKDIPAAYWAQAIVTTATTIVGFALVATLAGPWAGLLAAALIGSYPPLLLATRDQLSEPLGALLLLSSLLALTLAMRRRSSGLFAVCGALLGLAVLTRTDLLPVPIVLAAGLLAWSLRGRAGRVFARRGAALVAGCALLVIAPWAAYASYRVGRVVPVTDGSSAALFVGTFVPGGGTTVGMKRALAPEIHRVHPGYRGMDAFHVPASDVLAMVARRTPEVPAAVAIGKAARHNLLHYTRTDPIGMARVLANKVPRMWMGYARGSHRTTSLPTRGWHVVLVLGGFAGLLAGAWRRRSPALAAILLTALSATAVHMLFVAQARYNLPLMPSVIAGGVAGWALLAGGRRTPQIQITDRRSRPQITIRRTTPATDAEAVEPVSHGR